ncbi:hypothetical protein [Nocardiopsis halophila]|uniref:hypothetical protein n=1 Tax=Nocardiopsis halophila TaxID=141692 RepID=UPI00034B6C6B|nr:hypothetical protein [Nocardiopsis halophila]
MATDEGGDHDSHHPALPPVCLPPAVHLRIPLRREVGRPAAPPGRAPQRRAGRRAGALPGDDPARIGDTEDPPTGTYLFNHFLARDRDTAVRTWKGVAGGYTAKTGVDNSTPLRALDDSRFAFVNDARLPGGAVPFLLGQLTRPSFHTFVRARLKADGMVALPLLRRPL